MLRREAEYLKRADANPKKRPKSRRTLLSAGVLGSAYCELIDLDGVSPRGFLDR